MANTGSFATTGYQGRHLVLSWETVSVDVGNNTTTISWSVKGAGNAQSSWYTAGNFTFVIDGETVYRSTQTVRLYNGTVVASGTKIIRHNGDGARSFAASVSAGIYNYGGSNATGRGAWELDRIPRQATLTSAPNFTDEENPTITYSNPAAEAVTNLDACITAADETILADYRPISKTSGGYTFTLSAAERQKIQSYFSTTVNGTVRFFVRSEIGGIKYYSELSRTLTIVNAAPTIAPSVWDMNDKTIALTGDKNKLIRYRSKGGYDFGASAHKGASIVSYKLQNGPVVEEGHASGWVDFVQNKDFAFTVVDSRGYSATKVVTTDCVQYVVPSISFSKIALDTNGDLAVSVAGLIYTGSFGKATNGNLCYIRYKEQGGVYSEWQSMPGGIHGDAENKYAATFTMSGLDYSKTYVIQAAVEDSFVFISTDERVVVSTPLYRVGKYHFTFDAPIVSGPVYGLGGVPDKHFIWSGSDLNSYTVPDTYAIATSSEASGIKNAPIKVAGKLYVSASVGYSTDKEYFTYIRQEYVPFLTTESTYTRWAQKNDIGVWVFSPWESALTSSAMGSSGHWNYVKLTNGLAIAECRYPINMLLNKEWNGLWIANEVGGLSYPFTFVSPPTEVATIISDKASSINCWAVSDVPATTSTSGVYMPTRSSKLDWNATGYLNLIVFGRWK